MRGSHAPSGEPIRFQPQTTMNRPFPLVMKMSAQDIKISRAVPPRCPGRTSGPVGVLAGPSTPVPPIGPRHRAPSVSWPDAKCAINTPILRLSCPEDRVLERHHFCFLIFHF
ncbi:hypothetical protein B224_p00017 (plasmid) [Aeromonas media WS]|nr:hypothetical protein B224_p00017 [Aeromonas media WS]